MSRKHIPTARCEGHAAAVEQAKTLYETPAYDFTGALLGKTNVLDAADKPVKWIDDWCAGYNAAAQELTELWNSDLFDRRKLTFAPIRALRELDAGTRLVLARAGHYLAEPLRLLTARQLLELDGFGGSRALKELDTALEDLVGMRFSKRYNEDYLLLLELSLLGLSSETLECLHKAGFRTVGDVLGVPDDVLRQLDFSDSAAAVKEVRTAHTHLGV